MLSIDAKASEEVLFVPGFSTWLPVLYQVLSKQVPVPVPVPVVQVPVPNLQVPVPVQVLCINYWHSGTLQSHKVKVVVFFIFKKNEQLEPMNFKHKVW